jgi:hypothetical protein
MKKTTNLKFFVVIVIAMFCSSLLAVDAKPITKNEEELLPKVPTVHVSMTPLMKELGYSEEEIKAANMSTMIRLMREYPTPAKLSTDGNFYATPIIENKVDYTEPEFNVLNSSQEIKSSGALVQQYTLDGTGGLGKACILISIWDYWQEDVLPKLPQADYDEYYSHMVNCGKYNFWNDLTNGEAERYYIWAWITWACAEYDEVDVIMTGHGSVWVSESIASSVYCSWDVQCGWPGFLFYWNFFYPQEIYDGWSQYDYGTLRMGNLHFCNSWGGSWFSGFEPAFDGCQQPGHQSAFMGFSDIGYTSSNFAREWGDRWLYWGTDSWTAYSDSLWAQDHQWDYPLWYSDHGGSAIYA